MSDIPKVPSIIPGAYRHFKNGKLYEVLGVGLHSETHEIVVVYKPLYVSDAEFWVRPYEMFVEQVEHDGKLTPRFHKVED